MDWQQNEENNKTFRRLETRSQSRETSHVNGELIEEGDSEANPM